MRPSDAACPINESPTPEEPSAATDTAEEIGLLADGYAGVAGYENTKLSQPILGGRIAHIGPRRVALQTENIDWRNLPIAPELPTNNAGDCRRSVKIDLVKLNGATAWRRMDIGPSRCRVHAKSGAAICADIATAPIGDGR